ncbi:hypothetical protein ES676_07315 [Bizionia saleffrena]|uniref:Uncharacterized protein n=1 Tax=Bizionia saleffrena TaxID=291189 RepID=A0A8H2QLN1_9FLAO|nr:hypothetical protein [Bizionia saleffrena]TYB74478.1 hypothetical protein ES676_07315 [Bizionia saleffrena]
MHKKLLKEAFEKAKKEEGLIKKTHIAEFLSDYITENSGEPYGEKIIRIHYNNAIAITNEKVVLKQFAVICLCTYLGHDDFNGYKKKSEVKTRVPNRSFLAKHKIKALSIAILALLLIVFSALTINTQKWMVWENDRFTEVEFNTEKYRLNQLKLYKEDRILSFRKVTLHCDSIFFNANKSVRFWYGKNTNKEIDFFTALGLHPKTGKTLKPITPYMIKKYICN